MTAHPARGRRSSQERRGSIWRGDSKGVIVAMPVESAWKRPGDREVTFLFNFFADLRRRVLRQRHRDVVDAKILARLRFQLVGGIGNGSSATLPLLLAGAGDG